MFKHSKLIAYGKCKCAAASAFTENYRYNGGFQRHKLGNILCYSLALTSFFGFNSAECARCINKADNGSVKLLRLICKPESLSVALGMRH